MVSHWEKLLSGGFFSGVPWNRESREHFSINARSLKALLSPVVTHEHIMKNFQQNELTKALHTSTWTRSREKQQEYCRQKAED
jgi:hypothetical protein